MTQRGTGIERAKFDMKESYVKVVLYCKICGKWLSTAKGLRTHTDIDYIAQTNAVKRGAKLAMDSRGKAHWICGRHRLAMIKLDR
jgi:hypothetical protein